MNIHEFDPWIGRQKQERDILALATVRRMAAALDRDAGDFSVGGELPAGWHSVLFSPLAATRDLDVDGHPRRGDFLPPIPLPRRLFAGRRLKFLRPLRIGDEIVRTSEITNLRQVEGKSGVLAFVTVRHMLNGEDGQMALIEEQDVVYREEVAKGASREVPPHDTAEWTAPLSFGALGLFRFSAAVFNAHRIHFDADYARNVEGYDGLIVNASFITLHMLRHGELNWAEPIAGVDVRNRALVMADVPIEVIGGAVEGKRLIQAVQNGRLCVEMRVNP